MTRTKIQLERLIRGAMGESKADLIITGGKLINVYSGEILDGMEIAVLDGRICYVGLNAKHTRGEATEILDAREMYVSPGFIDAHTHIGHYCRPYEHLQSYIAYGTTAVVASCDELATVFGYRGLKLFLDEVEAHPLRVYTLVSMVAPQDPLLCSTASFSDVEIAEALADPRVLGMGEIVSWLRLVQCDAELLRRIEMAHRNGQIIHGHTAGARDQKLCAVAAMGISSCHEPIRLEDAIERLRLGYWTMLREGSLRQDLEATLKPLIDLNISLQRLILVTDSVTPDDAQERGQMNHVVRRAISLGLPAMQAIQAVTINPATYSGLEQEVGGIAPGRFADVALLDDLEQCHVRRTLIGGEVVADKGVAVIESRPISLSPEMMNCLGLRPTVSPLVFKVPCRGASAKIRVMELINQTITAERIVEVKAVGDVVEANVYEDLLKVAVFDRHGHSEKVAMGFLRGFGLKLGAVGTTVNLDENTLMVVGSSDEDMALCANTLIECGGGMTIANRGQVLEKIEFPFGGIFSLYPWQEVGKRLSRIQRCLRENGSTFDKPMHALIFLTFVTLPALRITARGLINAKERKIVSLFAD
ncbi:MAG TPA: adenine deaminase C-terminal domain-containing protein [Methylomirabilota bacterium]|nr:adenine deaminase C-terminal domain-containing protein [Methylomirabilota bacterium]